jgi:hypothetical protein
MLLLNLDDKNEGKPLSYCAEADISHFVRSALRDAVKLASTVAGKTFNVRHEMSFFRSAQITWLLSTAKRACR